MAERFQLVDRFAALVGEFTMANSGPGSERGRNRSCGAAGPPRRAAPLGETATAGQEPGGHGVQPRAPE